MLKKILKRTFQILLLAFIVIQFIRPAKNKSDGISNNDITKAYPVPENVQAILKSSCYDCHSNNTVYPWYASIQPAAWLLNDHIQEGKKELNFSEFANRRPALQNKKFDEIIKQVQDGVMPLNSYTIVHRDAVLTDEQRKTIVIWAGDMIDSLKARYPADSLVLRRRG